MSPDSHLHQEFGGGPWAQHFLNTNLSTTPQLISWHAYQCFAIGCFRNKKKSFGAIPSSSLSSSRNHPRVLLFNPFSLRLVDVYARFGLGKGRFFPCESAAKASRRAKTREYSCLLRVRFFSKNKFFLGFTARKKHFALKNIAFPSKNVFFEYKNIHTDDL